MLESDQCNNFVCCLKVSVEPRKTLLHEEGVKSSLDLVACAERCTSLVGKQSLKGFISCTDDALFTKLHLIIVGYVFEELDKYI